MKLDHTIDVVDAKSLKKKYKGARLDPEMVDEECEAYMNEDEGEFEWTFSYLVDWTGEEYTYTFHAEINPDCSFKRIYAPHCERLVYDDARGSEYRAKRMDEFDYHIFERRLRELIDED